MEPWVSPCGLPSGRVNGGRVRTQPRFRNPRLFLVGHGRLSEPVYGGVGKGQPRLSCEGTLDRSCVPPYDRRRTRRCHGGLLRGAGHRFPSLTGPKRPSNIPASRRAARWCARSRQRQRRRRPWEACFGIRSSQSATRLRARSPRSRHKACPAASSSAKLAWGKLGRSFQ